MAKSEVINAGIFTQDHKLFVIPHKPNEPIRFGKPIKTALGPLHTVFCGRESVGKMLDCKFLIGEEQNELAPRFKGFRISTTCNQHIYVDDDVCIYSSGSYLFAGFQPDYPIDGDHNK
jgi:hypothetical protein